jgi:hypothetical protein
MAALFALPVIAPDARAHGQLDPNALVTAPHGTFNGVEFTRYETMFEGVTSNNRPYRVPCQIIAPDDPGDGSGLVLFDWLVRSTIFTVVGQEQADARYTMSDQFLFGTGASYATVRCDPAGIGKQSPIVDPSRPWSDDLLDTSSEFILSAGDEYDIVADYVRALKSDPLALQLLGTVDRTAAFSYSAGGYRLRGMLRIQLGVGLFDFSLVGGTGNGFDHPSGNDVKFSSSEKPPKPGAGLELDFQSETEIVLLGAEKTRHEEPNYRVYQFAGAAHLRDIDCVEFALADPLSANVADWTPFFRALFVAGNDWCDGIAPPASLWLGAPNRRQIFRDANGNALVRFVGTHAVSSLDYRLPEVAVGENQYIAVAPQFDDGTFTGMLRTLAGSHVDLTSQFTDHAAYVQAVTVHANDLVAQRYLLQADADAIIDRANQSSIGL